MITKLVMKKLWLGTGFLVTKIKGVPTGCEQVTMFANSNFGKETVSSSCIFHSPPSNAKVKNGGAILPLPHTP
jgi:hypothetical protein